MRPRSPSPGARARSGALLVAAGLALLLGGRAQALTLYFEGAEGYGIDPALVSDAEAAGIPVVDPQGSLALMSLRSDGDPTAPFRIDVTDPVPSPRISTPTAPSKADPVMVADEWSLTNFGADRSQLWLVFVSNSLSQVLSGETYDPGEVGLELDPVHPWGLLQGGPDTYYPAFHVGPLGSGETAEVPVRYRVARSLLTNAAGEPTLPKLLVGEASAPIPEPSTLALLGAGLVGLAAAGRSR